MTPCEDCGLPTPWPGLDVGVNLHAHQAPGQVACKRHGPGQDVMAVHGGARPKVWCRACWIEVYAHAQAFLHAAMGALEDHNDPAKAAGTIPPAGLDLGAILRNVANGKCWCGKPVRIDRHSATGYAGSCEAGHGTGVHRFDGGFPA